MPTFQETLDLAATVLRQRDGVPLHVEAKLENGFLRSGDDSRDSVLLDLFRQRFAEIDRDYRDRWERAASADEIAYALCFVLRPDMPDYASDGTSIGLRDIDVRRS